MQHYQQGRGSEREDVHEEVEEEVESEEGIRVSAEKDQITLQ